VGGVAACEGVCVGCVWVVGGMRGRGRRGLVGGGNQERVPEWRGGGRGLWKRLRCNVTAAMLFDGCCCQCDLVPPVANAKLILPTLLPPGSACHPNRNCAVDPGPGS
jgi:hypothetical protein